ncbi:hypothetical protein T459_29966 [Capsicum annuum]|uniref:Ubiquitin-like protease family profile domain-containing protein n=1 Tax=Capsicum annuum TaxID=4072 RepID=A0A2G2Y7J4_CAPAN|nr:hypothetical protein FXO37_29444 [Capsicum annuum]PHT65541.1 hypothetical protein T459_29966 [Capsicum annuum]
MTSISWSMNEVQNFYRLSGLPYVLQIWWYECYAKVDESLAIRVQNIISRMMNWKVVKPKPRYEDLMDDMFSKLVYRNITLPPLELNHLDFPNLLMFGSTDAAANIAQAVAVQQQSEKTAPTEFRDEFDDSSTPPSVGLLKKMRLDTDSSIDHSEPRVSLDKDKVVLNIEMRDADKAPTASEENLSLSKSDLDEIKSYVRTYVDMKFNDLQKLMVDRYTGLLGFVKEGFDSFVKVAQYSVHESEKGNPNIEVDSPQSVNKHTTDAKSYNVVDVSGQSSKLGINKGETEESLKKTESSYEDKLQEDDRHITDAEVVEAIMKERESEKALHNTDKDLSKAIPLYVPPSRVTYPTGINYEDAATIDTCDRQGNIDSQCYISNNDIAAISQFLLQHIDVVFYYLRKKAKMDTTSEYRYTTVNCIFMNYIHDTYTHYHRSHSEIDLSSHVENIRSMKVASVEGSIYEIMQGLCISGGIPWNLIDEVYVPINYKGSFHWVLVVRVLKERCIHVYDSMKGHRGYADEIKELAEILSTYLTISDFFEKKDRTIGYF